MMKPIQALVNAVLITSAAASASAAVISMQAAPIAGQPGKFEVNLFLDTEAAPGVVSFDLTIKGEGGMTINNIPGFGQPQTRESSANTPDQFDPNYKKVNDSWFDDIGDGGGLNTLGFAVIAPSEGPNPLAGGLATDVTVNPPQSFQSGRIAHLNVTGGGSGFGGGVRITGAVAVGNLPVQTINYLTPFFPSEPTSGTMTALALLAFTAFRRRRLA